MTHPVVARALLRRFERDKEKLDEEYGVEPGDPPDYTVERFSALIDGDWRTSVALKLRQRDERRAS